MFVLLEKASIFANMGEKSESKIEVLPERIKAEVPGKT